MNLYGFKIGVAMGNWHDLHWNVSVYYPLDRTMVEHGCWLATPPLAIYRLENSISIYRYLLLWS